jgi:streptogramin lyase
MGTPTTSRTGRASRRIVSPRAAKLTPVRRVTSSSSRVLYRSDAATPAAYRARPSRASQRSRPDPSTIRARTLFAMATWVCRSGSPSRDSR